MRWVFFCLLILNVVYLVWSLVLTAAPDPVQPAPSAVLQGASRLVLLSEAGVESGGAMPPSRATVPAAAPELCVSLGPWPERAGAEAATQSLAAKGYRGSVRSVRVVKDRLHWVYLPPQSDRELAMRTLRELQNRQVDSFIVAEGADANAISLGYFSSPESARGLMVKMRSAGYPAEIRETSREVTEYWAWFEPGDIPDDGVALRDWLAAHEGQEGRHVACEPDVTPTP